VTEGPQLRRQVFDLIEELSGERRVPPGIEVVEKQDRQVRS
jgi:hypothetical protein